MQVVHPGAVYVTRGNHETVLMTTKYGFQKEVELKYNDVALLTRFHQAFCSLPVAVVVENTCFITHGGLGAKTHLMSDDLNKLNRFVEPHRKSELWELIWSGTYSCFTLGTLHCTDCVA
jgi:serine/threonine-protein phosphatase 5